MNKEKFLDIERLRGFACILVMIQHLYWICPFSFVKTVVPSFLAIGSGGVHVFFAISGFVITLSIKGYLNELYGKLFLERFVFAKKFLLSFYKRRFFRIMPVVLIVVVMVGLFLNFTEENTIWLSSLIRAPLEIVCGVFNNYVELFSLTDRIHCAGIGPFWTVAIDAQFYVLWPIILIMCKDDNIRAIVSFILGCVFMLIVQPLSVAFYSFKYYAIYNNIAELFLGSFFAFVYNERISISSCDCSSKVVTAILLMVIWVYPSCIENSVIFSNVVISIASVSVVVFAASHNGCLDFPILGQVLKFLGERSFSFYAVQLCLANIIATLCGGEIIVKNSFSEHMFGFFPFMLFIILQLAVSELSYKLVERPSRKVR